MSEKHREFEMVYSQDEMEQRIEQLKMHGYSEQDIHVLARDKEVFNSYESRSNVDTHEAESASSKFKSFFSGEDAVHTELRNLGLEEPSIDRYSEDIKKGAILLYTDGDSRGRERDNFSSFGDDSRPVDADERKRNTAFTPFGRDIERDGEKFNDEKIQDPDVRKGESDNRTTYSGDPTSSAIEKDSERIYTTEVKRENQHADPSYGNKFKDSRLNGENIHPTTDTKHEEQDAVKKKSFEHEPQLETEAQEEDLNREEGVNRRQDEPSPGVDPNLGPAPFGRDSEEEHLIKEDDNQNGGTGHKHEDPKHTLDGHDEVDHRQNPRDARSFHDDVEKKTSTPPTPRLF